MQVHLQRFKFQNFEDRVCFLRTVKDGQFDDSEKTLVHLPKVLPTASRAREETEADRWEGLMTELRRNRKPWAVAARVGFKLNFLYHFPHAPFDL